MLKLCEVLLKCHGAVVGIEYLLTVDGGGEGAHGELGGVVVAVFVVRLVALHDVALASLQHVIGREVLPYGSSVACCALGTRVAAYYP